MGNSLVYKFIEFQWYTRQLSTAIALLLANTIWTLVWENCSFKIHLTKSTKERIMKTMNCKYKEKLYFTTLNYTQYYILHPKLFKCMFCALNYEFVTLCTSTLSLVLTWMKKYNTIWKDLIVHLLNLLKTSEKLHFTTLNYIPFYTLHSKFWIYIQVNTKFNVEVQSVTRVIV